MKLLVLNGYFDYDSHEPMSAVAVPDDFDLETARDFVRKTSYYHTLDLLDFDPNLTVLDSGFESWFNMQREKINAAS